MTPEERGPPRPLSQTASPGGEVRNFGPKGHRDLEELGKDSAVRTANGKNSGGGDFFGWIYRNTIMELWAYATQ